MNSQAKALLERLIEEYVALSETKANEKIPFNEYIGTNHGSIYVRKMVISNYFCLASFGFDDSCQNQGVLTSFINYIKENRYSYGGIMVENSQNPVITESLYKQGFKLKPVDPMCDEISPTLIFDFNES